MPVESELTVDTNRLNFKEMIMFTYTKLKALAVSTIAIAGGHAVAGTSVSAAYPETVVNAIQTMGYKAELTVDSYGDPLVRSASEGVNFSLNFYGCDDDGNDCQHLQFSVAFDVVGGMDYLSMNAWNRETTMGKAFLDEESDPVLQHYMIAVDGMSGDVFQESFEFWTSTLSDFTDYIDW